ncbi:cupin [Psychrobacillus vulpis]|uniref:Cupin n=1 Tax=Psychrobacillus vulpis TaxID=2325572 RepID=A0A544TSV0_9BACI|nr:cupin [Psychrobacillus vulpis]TQR20514.1 cupin [Psychrobacillus vulpis]
MELYKFNKDSGKKISKFNSDFIMSRVIQTDKVTHIGCMHLDENGIVGYHQAIVPQLLLIMSGEGYVRGKKEEFIKVQTGDAVFWEKDEWHETKTSDGLTAIVIESEELNPSFFMPLKK